MKRAFSLGKIFMTGNVVKAIDTEVIFNAIKRHSNCDWGDLYPKDKKLNDDAVKHGNRRIVSIYHDARGTKFLITTEVDKSATTVTLPGNRIIFIR